MPDAPPLIDDGHRALFDGPSAIMFGTVDPVRTPDVTRGCGLVALDDRRIRVLVSSAAPEVLANAQPGRRCALLVTDITTYRSIQWKGTVLTGGMPRTPGDVAVFHRLVEHFVRGSQVFGLPAESVLGMFPHDVVAIEIEVDSCYDQSPGPAAGRRVG